MTGEGFALADLTARVRGEAGFVRVVFEGHLNVANPTAKLVAECGGGPGATVQQVLDYNGILDKLANIERELRSKGYGTPNGYTLHVVDEEGDVVHEAVDLTGVLTLPVEDGQVIVLSGKVAGAQ